MIAFIGGGNMAEALIKGMTGSGMKDIIVSEPRAERREELAKRYGITCTDDSVAAVGQASIVILAVKPQSMQEVMEMLAPHINNTHTVVSIAAGITLAYYQKHLKTERIVRVMPNVAALLQQSMSVLSLCDCFTGPEINRVKEIFMAGGRVLVLPEKQMDAVTALSGSGPAFVALFMDAMVKAAVTLGLSEDDALTLATQTFVGTAALLDGPYRPQGLIEIVRSPGGTTAEGLKVFESEGLAGITQKALNAAAHRSAELAR